MLSNAVLSCTCLVFVLAEDIYCELQEKPYVLVPFKSDTSDVDDEEDDDESASESESGSEDDDQPISQMLEEDGKGPVLRPVS